jgi:hypothetical protein
MRSSYRTGIICQSRRKGNSKGESDTSELTLGQMARSFGGGPGHLFCLTTRILLWPPKPPPTFSQFG